MPTPTAADLRAIIGLRPAAAIEYLERKGFAITWNWNEVNASTHARALTVAKATRLDVLQDIRNGLLDGLEQGQTLREFQRNLRPRLEAKGWWGRQIVVSPDGSAEVAQLGSPHRLATIYQTNMQSAYMAGRYMAALEARETHPYWMYIAVMDGVTRPSHAALHGKVFRWDDPIWRHITPPNGYNCRCRIVALTEAEVKRRGLKVESSEGKTGTETVETGVDQRTGEIRSETLTTLETTDRAGKRMRFRPDAGFDGSPVQSHLMDDVLLRKAQRTLGDAAGLAEVQQVLLEPVRRRAWDAFVDNARSIGWPQGQSMAFGVLNPRDLEFVKAQGANVQSGVVFLSDKLLAGSKARRHERASNALSVTELKSLPEAIAQAEQVLWDTENRTLLYILPGGTRRAKIAVRFNRLKVGRAHVDDAATVFKVPLGNIEEGIQRGSYTPVR